MFRRLGITSVVAANALKQILAKTCTAASGFLATPHVTIKHSSAIGNHIGLVGFEPTAFLFNDTSTTEIYTLSLHDALPIFARVALLRSEWQSFPCGLEPTALHVSSPWNHQRCGGECAQANSRKNLHCGVRFSCYATRNNKTFFSHW